MDITLYGANLFNMTVDSVYVEPGYSAVDDEGNDVTADVVVDQSELDTSVVGIYRIKYTLDIGGIHEFVYRTVVVGISDGIVPGEHIGITDSDVSHDGETVGPRQAPFTFGKILRNPIFDGL